MRPSIQGDAMRKSRGGDYYRWKQGPLEVEINQSVDFDQNGRRDWHVVVGVFGQMVAEGWGRTAVSAAAWANRKIASIERALLAPRPVGRSER